MSEDARAPESPADLRPEGRPFYIGPNCPNCAAPLVLTDAQDGRKPCRQKIWHDEWECPQCRDGLYMDWPASEGAVWEMG
jgi:hypothetical protein